MLPPPVVGKFPGEKGHQFLHESWILALAKWVETSFMVSISDMPTIKYWKNLGSMMDKVKARYVWMSRSSDLWHSHVG